MNRRFLPITLTSLAVLMTQTASADSYTPQYDACMDQSAGATADMHQCIDEEYARQDARLNRVYKQIMDTLSDERKQQLREAQRQWIKYRDVNCAFYFDKEGGTLAGVQAAACALDMTVKRADELQIILDMAL